MKKSFLGVVLSLGLLSAAHADVYKFDNTHTNAVFNIDHFQTSTNHGGFYAISGELKYQPEKQDAEMRVTTARFWPVFTIVCVKCIAQKAVKAPNHY